MSILLESLTQSDKNEVSDLEKNIPNVDDSHFDDEMFNDDDLLKKLKFWKLISFGAVASLIISWSWFYMTDVSKVKANVPSQNVVAMPAIPSPVVEPSLKNIEDNFNIDKATLVTAVNYQPKKIISKIEQEPEVIPKVTFKPLQNIPNISKKSIVDFESLTDQMVSEMPELDINSYAVSDNAKKSFVVLNGSFYAEGEIISPNMTLVKITQKNIIVNYKNQLIRKKY